MFEGKWMYWNFSRSIEFLYKNKGGSHDRTKLLPLKAGVCIMALGAMAKYGLKVKIITCGFNYFKGHRFRSKVII